MKEIHSLDLAVSGHLLNFDVLRLLFAVFVIFSHSFALLGFADPVQALVRTTTPGGLGVDGFFLISGYLITRSWVSDPSVGRFLARRMLRLYPGFIVASLVSVLIVGPLGADAAQYFQDLDLGGFVRGLLLLHDPQTPRVFAGTPVETVNGSMWTISFEFRCYLVAMLCGCIGLLSRRRIVLVITLLVGAAICYTVPESGPTDSQHQLFGLKALRVSDYMAWFAALFLTGSCFFLFRERIRYTLTGWVVAFAVLVWSLFYPEWLRPGVLLAGAYVMFGVAAMPALRRVRSGAYVDLSYGLYLYGWPVQKLLSWYWPNVTPWPMFCVTMMLCTGLAWLSWHLVEQPALRLKPGAAKRLRFRTATADMA
ncbi:acyltransferase family protein [Paraburkholderia sediminicola]|uniref:acyltransferase family protein n=1 Tax=Paraburkholderia sediminicola TaxID=458836 RepID=UPI0038BBEE8C